MAGRAPFQCGGTASEPSLHPWVAERSAHRGRGGSDQISRRSKVRRRMARDAHLVIADETVTCPALQVISDQGIMDGREAGCTASARMPGTFGMSVTAAAAQLDLPDRPSCGLQDRRSRRHESMGLSYRCACGCKIGTSLAPWASLGRSGRYRHEYDQASNQQDEETAALSAPRS